MIICCEEFYHVVFTDGYEDRLIDEHEQQRRQRTTLYHHGDLSSVQDGQINGSAQRKYLKIRENPYMLRVVVKEEGV